MAISVKHSGGVGSRFLGEFEGSSGKRRAQQVPAAMSQMFQDSARDRQNQWQVYLSQQREALGQDAAEGGEAPRKMQVRRIEQDQLRLGERPQLRGPSAYPLRARPQPQEEQEAHEQKVPVQQNQQEEAQEGTPQEEPRKPIRLNAVVRRKIREMESQYDNMVNEGKTSPEALKQIRENIDHWIRSAYVAEAQGRSFVDASEAQIAFEESIVENPETGEKGLVDPKSGKFTPFTQDSPPKRTVEEIVKQDTYKDEEGNLWALDASGSPKIIKQATVKSEPSRPGYPTEEEMYARQQKLLEQVRNMTVTETDKNGVETERPATPQEKMDELNRLNEEYLALDTLAKKLPTYSYSGAGIVPGDPFYEPEEEEKPKRGKKRPPGISVQVTSEEVEIPAVKDFLTDANKRETVRLTESYNKKTATIADQDINGFNSTWITSMRGLDDFTPEMKNDTIRNRENRVAIYGWILDEIEREAQKLREIRDAKKFKVGDDIPLSFLKIQRDLLKPGSLIFKLDGTIDYKFIEQSKNHSKNKMSSTLKEEAVKGIEVLLMSGKEKQDDNEY